MFISIPSLFPPATLAYKQCSPNHRQFLCFNLSFRRNFLANVAKNVIENVNVNHRKTIAAEAE
jgi:hypothetical protein